MNFILLAPSEMRTREKESRHGRGGGGNYDRRDRSRRYIFTKNIFSNKFSYLLAVIVVHVVVHHQREIVVVVVVLLLLLVVDLVRHIHVRLYLDGKSKILIEFLIYENVASDDDNSCYS